MFKVCNKCKINQHKSFFFKNKRIKDGLRSLCKECEIESIKKWRKTLDGKLSRKKEHQKYALKRNPYEDYKIVTVRLVNCAIAAGLIKKEYVCSVCKIDTIAENKKIHGHHEDYLKPLSVTWVCAKCHVAIHRKEAKE